MEHVEADTGKAAATMVAIQIVLNLSRQNGRALYADGWSDFLGTTAEAGREQGNCSLRFRIAVHGESDGMESQHVCKNKARHIWRSRKHCRKIRTVEILYRSAHGRRCHTLLVAGMNEKLIVCSVPQHAERMQRRRDETPCPAR
ncbi:hypothetical protein ES708_17630 [subsurface metagenome]